MVVFLDQGGISETIINDFTYVWALYEQPKRKLFT